MESRTPRTSGDIINGLLKMCVVQMKFFLGGGWASCMHVDDVSNAEAHTGWQKKNGPPMIQNMAYL